MLSTSLQTCPACLLLLMQYSATEVPGSPLAIICVPVQSAVFYQVELHVT